jgi:hypothetical protein
MANPRTYTPFPITPRDGGRLIVNTSQDALGVAHYVKKVNFRRYLDQEIRREGWDYFWPNDALSKGDVSQGVPYLNTGKPITLVHEGISPTGKRFLICASGDKLYRYLGNSFWYVEPPYNIVNWAPSTANVVLSRAPNPVVKGNYIAPSITKSFEANNGKYVFEASAIRAGAVTGATEPNWTAIPTKGEVVTTGTISANTVVKIIADDPSGTDFTSVGGPNNTVLPSKIGETFIHNGTGAPAGNIPAGVSFEKRAGVWDGDVFWERVNHPFPLAKNFILFFKQGMSEIFAGDVFFNYRAELVVAKIVKTSGSWGSTATGYIHFKPTVGMPKVGNTLIRSGGTPSQFGVASGAEAAAILGATFGGQLSIYQTEVVYDGYYTNRVEYYDYVLVDTVGQGWTVIGEGFNDVAHTYRGISGDIATGPQWESVSINGYSILNNGIDLPVVYRDEWFGVKPLYELREIGVGRVGTISSYLSFLICADVYEVIEKEFTPIMMSSNPCATLNDAQLTRRQFKQVWSAYGEPTRFASTVNVNVPIPPTNSPGQFSVACEWVVNSLSVGQKMQFAYSELLGEWTIKSINVVNGINYKLVAGHYSVITFEEGCNLVAPKLPAETLMSASDMVNSHVGFSEIQDDSSQIIKMAPLRDKLVIYRDSSIYLMSFSGDPVAPFTFEPLYRGNKGVYYKHSFIGVEHNYHMYAGRDAFYRFDLSSRLPKTVQTFDYGSDMHDKVTIDDTNWVVASHNPTTSEFWWSYPIPQSLWGLHTTSDGIVLAGETLCWDYGNDSLSLVDYQFTAMGSIKQPLPDVNLESKPMRDWFIMGAFDGILYQYGKTDDGYEIFYRRSHTKKPLNPVESRETYTSVIESGLTPFGDTYSEKDIRAYLLQLSTRYPALVTVEPEDFVDYQPIYSSGETTLAAYLANVGKVTYFTTNYDFGHIVRTGDGDWRWMEGTGLLAAHYASGDVLVKVTPKIELFGANSLADNPPLLLETVTMANYKDSNLWPLHYRSFFFKDRITLDGWFNPFAFVQRVFDVSRVVSISLIQGIFQSIVHNYPVSPPLPTLLIIPSIVVGFGQDVVLTAVVTGFTSPRYQWYKGAGTSSPVGTNSPTLTITVPAIGDYVYWVKVTES